MQNTSVKFDKTLLFKSIQEIMVFADGNVIEYDAFLFYLRRFYKFQISYRCAKAMIYLWSLASEDQHNKSESWKELFDSMCNLDSTRDFDWHQLYGSTFETFCEALTSKK